MKLIWNNNLDRAIDQAQKMNKPILSLALLGRLDEEHSCANSRFFKKTLYPNRDVGTALAHDFVLHWRTVRPVPKIRIDFGDGRVVESTVTGNSAHLVLDPNGRVADAIPGLYTPSMFLPVLKRGGAIAKQIAALGEARAIERLRAYHSDRSRVLAQAQRAPKPPSKYPTAREAGGLAMTKMRVEDPILRLIEATAGDDALFNEQTLHRQVHQRFATDDVALEREPFVAWLYEAVFKMPLDDPWLGLGDLALAS